MDAEVQHGAETKTVMPLEWYRYRIITWATLAASATLVAVFSLLLAIATQYNTYLYLGQIFATISLVEVSMASHRIFQYLYRKAELNS